MNFQEGWIPKPFFKNAISSKLMISKSVYTTLIFWASSIFFVMRELSAIARKLPFLWASPHAAEPHKSPFKNILFSAIEHSNQPLLLPQHQWGFF